MMDEINNRNIESQIRDRDENAKTNALYRQATMEKMVADKSDREVQELQRRGSMLTPGQDMVPGSDTNFIEQQAPNLVIPGQPGTVPLGPGEVGPSQPATPKKFRGFPVQIEAIRKAKLQEDAQAKLEDPDFEKKYTVAQRAAIYRLATGSEPSMDIIGGRKEPAHSANYVEYLDAKSEGYKGTFPQYQTEDANRKRVQPPQDHGTFLDRPVLDAQGNPVPSQVYIMRNGKLTIETVPGGGSLGAKPSTSGSKAIITPTDDRQYAKLRGLGTTQPGGLSGFLPDKKPTEKAKAEFLQFEDSLYGRFPSDISNLVKTIVKTTPAGVSNEDIITHGLEEGSILPEDRAMVYQLLQTIRSR